MERGWVWGWVGRSETCEELVHLEGHGMHCVAETGQDIIKVKVRSTIVGLRHGGMQREHQC